MRVLPGMPKVPKITSLQYFKKEVKEKYDFLHEDKYQSFLQAGSIVITGHSQIYQKYPK